MIFCLISTSIDGLLFEIFVPMIFGSTIGKTEWIFLLMCNILISFFVWLNEIDVQLLIIESISLLMIGLVLLNQTSFYHQIVVSLYCTVFYSSINYSLYRVFVISFLD